MRARRERLCGLIRRLFDEFRQRYGSPRIHRALLDLGEACDRKTVASLMREMGLRAKGRKRFRVRTTDSHHDHPIAPNLLQRDFTAQTPNTKWVTDLTYVDTDEGWLYLVTVIDLFSRKVVGYAQADHMRAELCVEAVESAARQRGKLDGLILHPRGATAGCSSPRASSAGRASGWGSCSR